jgi:hypothetical protein
MIRICNNARSLMLLALGLDLDSWRRTCPWGRGEVADDGSGRHDTEREEHKIPRNCDADDEGGHVVDEVAELLAEDIVHMQQDIYAHP